MILTHSQNVSHSQLSFFTYCSVILVGICKRRSNIYPLLRYEGIGGILFIFGSSLGAYLLIIHQLIAFPILYDF
ncbi:hypothetical protein Peur_046870 [Populus x canadensis]